MGFKIWPVVNYVIDKIPFEKILVRPPDRNSQIREFASIIKGSKPTPAEMPAKESPADIPEENPKLGNLGNTRKKVRLENNPAVTSSVTTKETVDYQNREIGKTLLVLQRHCIQKFRINGKACDCGQSRHLLELEALSEEAMAMVENPGIYEKILDWIKRLGPLSTVENVLSGKYDDKYPEFGNEARDLRKELLGTLDPKVLFPSTEPAMEVTVNETPEKAEETV